MKNNSNNASPLIKNGIIPGPTALTGMIVALSAFVIVFIVVKFSPVELAIWEKTGIFAISAMLLCFPFQLPKWWIAIFAILPVTYLLIEGQTFPVWIYPALAVTLLILNWNSFGDRVPLYLSNNKTVNSLSQLIEEKENKGVFCDLGCGVGSAIIPLAKIHPNVTFIGVETAPLTFLIAKLRCKFSGCTNIQILRKSIWDTSIQDAKIVYAFLSPHPMNKLLLKCKKELTEGATLISNSFDSDKFPAQEMIPVEDRRQTKLLVWDF